MCFEYFSQWILDNKVSIFKISFMIASLFSFMGPFTFCSELWDTNLVRYYTAKVIQGKNMTFHFTSLKTLKCLINGLQLMQLVGKRTNFLCLFLTFCWIRLQIILTYSQDMVCNHKYNITNMIVKKYLTVWYSHFAKKKKLSKNY